MVDTEILNYASDTYSKLKNLKFAINQSAIVATTDVKGTIISVNDKFCDISKYSKKELLGQNHRILKSGYHSHEFYLNLWKTISGGRVWVDQIKNKAKDGSFYWVHTTIIPFLDEKGKVYQYLSIRFDITPLKELEVSLEKKIVEAEKKNNELQIANKELELFNFISSHDLQEPLRKIQNFSALLMNEEKQLSKTGKDYFHRMQKTAKRMQILIEDLLAYSRIKRTGHKFERTDLNIILDKVINDYTEVIKEKHATLVIKKLCVVNVIPLQFRQLFNNLFSNMLKFTNPQKPPHIIIESKISKGNELNNKKLLPTMNYCHLIFTDNGIGFDSQYKDRIFDLLQRLHSIEDHDGSGIGLAICKKIVENHNGVITATGKLNKGAQFDIYIPLS